MRRAGIVLAAAAALAAGHAVAAEPWWSAFADSTLDQLMHGAAPADTAGEQALVETYIVARVDHARALLASRLLQAAREEEALLMDEPPGETRNAALADVARRLETFEGTAGAIASERSAVTADLARRSGIAPDKLTGLLQPSQAHQLLPRVDAPPPPGPGDERRQRVAAQAEDFERHSALLQARRLEMQAHEARQRAGKGDPLQALETYQQLVLESDGLALAGGRLALAWAQWLPAARK